MPRGGKRANAGRKLGVPNKATIERREQARIAEENAAMTVGSKPLDPIAGKMLAREVLEDFMVRFRRMALFHEVLADGSNPNADEGKFRCYARLATETARDLAQYQSPKLTAVAMGQVTKVTVTVIGGLPPRPE
jgi:hypothetical protein